MPPVEITQPPLMVPDEPWNAIHVVYTSGTMLYCIYEFLVQIGWWDKADIPPGTRFLIFFVWQKSAWTDVTIIGMCVGILLFWGCVSRCIAEKEYAVQVQTINSNIKQATVTKDTAQIVFDRMPKHNTITPRELHQLLKPVTDAATRIGTLQNTLHHTTNGVYLYHMVLDAPVTNIIVPFVGWYIGYPYVGLMLPLPVTMYTAFMVWKYNDRVEAMPHTVVSSWYLRMWKENLRFVSTCYLLCGVLLWCCFVHITPDHRAVKIVACVKEHSYLWSGLGYYQQFDPTQYKVYSLAMGAVARTRDDPRLATIASDIGNIVFSADPPTIADDATRDRLCAGFAGTRCAHGQCTSSISVENELVCIKLLDCVTTEEWLKSTRL